MTVLEDGQLDLTLLGEVVGRRRVGQIDPCPTSQADFEVTMRDKTGRDTKKLPGKFRTKKEAVAAEVAAAIEQEELMPTKGQKGETPSSSGGSEISTPRCPLCNLIMHPEVIVFKCPSTGAKQSKVLFVCRQTCPLSGG